MMKKAIFYCLIFMGIIIPVNTYGQKSIEKEMILFDAVVVDTPMYSIAITSKWGKLFAVLIKESQLKAAIEFLDRNASIIKNDQLEIIIDSLYQKFDAKYYMACSLVMEMEAELNRKVYLGSTSCNAKDTLTLDKQLYVIHKIKTDIFLTGLVKIKTLAKWTGLFAYIPHVNRNLYTYFYAPVIK